MAASAINEVSSRISDRNELRASTMLAAGMAMRAAYRRCTNARVKLQGDYPWTLEASGRMDRVSIRAETAADINAIHSVEVAAFGRKGEAVLVDALRELDQDFISLVASLEDEIVGHICFSRVSVEGSASDGIVLALAPLAVLPEHQRRGIGSMLVQCGLQECKRRNVDAVFVVGDPRYYSRLGFRSASEIDVRCEFDVPDDAFKVIELREGLLSRGVLRYSRPFHQV